MIDVDDNYNNYNYCIESAEFFPDDNYRKHFINRYSYGVHVPAPLNSIDIQRDIASCIHIYK